MPNIKSLINAVFSIESSADFNRLAIEVFNYQNKYNPIYSQYIDYLNIDISSIDHFTKIPFLPIEFFKTHQIKSGKFNPEVTFISSGTTGMSVSRHPVCDLSIYEKSFSKGFNIFFGNPSDYVILALLPSYLEREGSSLIYMAEKLIKSSGHSESGFYLNEYKQLSDVLLQLKAQNKKTILLGVTYALLNLSEQFPINFPDLIVMETGGMKGKRKEMVRDELHSVLTSSFGVNKIYSEYGMTELLSQAYSKGHGRFKTPPWMKVIIRDTNDPFSLLSIDKTGGVNIIDLANIHSCSFIETKDLGKIHSNGDFEILGRFDNSDVRGCNLLIG